MASQPFTWSSVSKTARGLLTTMQHTLTFFGVSALAMMALLYMRPELAHEASQLLAAPHKPAPVVVVARPPVQAPALSALMTAPAPAPAVLAPNEPPILALDDKANHANRKQQEFVTTWLSKRYRVAGDAANMLVSTAYSTAREIKLDPLLILAVMAIESGLNPFAESPVGAQGLMQVMSKIHHEKFQDMGGTKAALNPVANIRVGSLILKEYVKRGGSVEAGLKTYVGAAAFATDQGYGSRVMNEYQKLKLVASGKKVPTFTAPAAPKPVLVEKASQEQIAGL
ncbi:lytic transglycosylase domain-containing protein [Massilia sp. CCM 9210]|uniref:lytic transglycosylase domain-containing protein n=1 Tax=Massilia scottii TaxID=3057166 RepID=UPI002796D8DB|nr:lytic transglycosylase domain-containing protein [Massilia sp. CCM 9210]MDQ1816458.1 lytic transglycosylase domain-containing protein [Massilia sp. CCM 9210]